MPMTFPCTVSHSTSPPAAAAFAHILTDEPAALVAEFRHSHPEEEDPAAALDAKGSAVKPAAAGACESGALERSGEKPPLPAMGKPAAAGAIDLAWRA
jgi:hypothetical protein